ncbi:hypothetical protein P8452_44857 [Trifolium repens]|nr:hypothetical protein P8452_44857 [Trifolium repens]
MFRLCNISAYCKHLSIIEISAQIECGGNVAGIITQCKSFVSKDGPKIPPSKPCCDALKGANVSCYCKYVTPGIENMISIEKALYVAKTCQCQNIPTDKCGSYIIPHPAPPKA